MTSLEIDVDFDMRSDAGGRDPDSHSATLRRYHEVLWSKPLPGGELFTLSTTAGGYLTHASELGRFQLTSDTIIRTFRRMRRAAPLMAQIREEDQEAFSRRGYTIGGMMLFPGNRVAGGQTINQRRGTHPRISDRFDLTLECIRRYYAGEKSPLSRTLSLYPEFFALFGDFRGYVDFFLLQDLVTDDYAAVTFLMPFDDFHTPAVPTTVAEYEPYRAASLAFVEGRNARIASWWESERGGS